MKKKAGFKDVFASWVMYVLLSRNQSVTRRDEIVIAQRLKRQRFDVESDDFRA